jgi:hypothetical protein
MEERSHHVQEAHSPFFSSPIHPLYSHFILPYSFLFVPHEQIPVFPNPDHQSEICHSIIRFLPFSKKVHINHPLFVSPYVFQKRYLPSPGLPDSFPLIS